MFDTESREILRRPAGDAVDRVVGDGHLARAYRGPQRDQATDQYVRPAHRTKTLAGDRNIPKPESGHGLVVQYPDAKIARLSEEHGELDVTACDRVPAIGERVQVIPNHICPCVNLQDSAFIRMAEGELRSIKIDARGKLS